MKTNLQNLKRALFAMTLLLSVGLTAWGTSYELVKSASQLVAGAKYIMADGTDGSVNVVSTASNTNNRKTTTATAANEKIVGTSAMLVLELGGSSNAWTFTTTNYGGTDGYLYNSDTKNNRLFVGDNTTANAFTISFANNAISSITCNGNTSKGVMCFNGTLVACYASKSNSYKVPQLYKEVSGGDETKYDITVDEEIAGGTVSADATSAEENATITLTATPATGYEFTSWNVTNASTSAAIDVVSNKFAMPAAAVNVSAVFTAVAADDDTKWTYNFNLTSSYPSGFPTSGTNVAEALTTTISGHDIIINAPNSYYIINPSNDNSRGLFFGKSVASNGNPSAGTAYLGFPARSGYKLTKVVVTTTSTVGAAKVNMYDDEWTAVSEEVTTVGSTEKEFTFALASSIANTEYRLASGASGKNLQFKSIVLTWEEAEDPTPEKTLTGIAVKTAPTKVYTEGETFDPTGLVITATYDDETTADIAYAGAEDKFTFAPALTAALATTDTKVTITYGGQNVDLDITVNEVVVTKYAIAIAGGIEHGTVAVEGELTEATEGATITLTAEPATGYKLTAYDVYKTGEEATKVTVTDGAFTMPAYDVTVSATFEEVVVEEPKYVFDFTVNNFGLPTSAEKNNVKSYTYDEKTITLHGDATNGFKFGGNSGDQYLILGKSGAYLTLPAFDFAVSKIEVVGHTGASASVVQNIFVGETAVSTATTGAALADGDKAAITNTYAIAAEYQGAGNVYTIKVTSSHNTQITYVKVYENTDVVSYNVNIASDIEHGTVKANVAKAGAGATVTLTATPSDGYELGAWTVKDASDNTIEVADNKFTMPAADVTVSATFTLIPVVEKFGITIDGEIENGTVAIEGALTEAAENDVITLTYEAADGYEFEAWVVKAADETPIDVTDNKFTMPAQAVKVSATFKLIPPSYLVYETGFESAEGFTKSSDYYKENVQGATDKQWTIYGTTTSDDKKTGEQSIQMRISKTLEFGKATNPYAYTNFDLNKVNKVEFAYRTSNTSCFKKFKVQYSLNSGSEWKDAQEITLSNTDWNANYVVNIPEQSATMRIRFLVTEWAQPSATQKFSIDDLKIYSTEPLPTAILAEDVEIEYNATSGAIAYTIQAPIAETEVVASTEDTWLSDFATEAEKVTFIAEANAAYVARTATVTLTYGTVTKDITVTQKAAPKPKFAISVAGGLVNGSVSIKDALTEAEEGTEIELVIKPASGYVLNVLTVVGEDESPIAVADNKFTMPAQAVTVSATFKEKPAVIVTLPHTGTFDGKHEEYTEGWTTTGTGKTREDCIIVGKGENLTSPQMDLSGYYQVVITFTGRRFGTLDGGSKATVDAAIVGGSSVGTIDITNGSVGDVTGSITFYPTAEMTAVKLIFTCTNATEAGSENGAGIGTVTITGIVAPTYELTITNDFGTMYWDKNWTVEPGVEVYYGNWNEAWGCIDLYQYTGTVVPANQGVIVRSIGASATTLTATAEEADGTMVGNEFLGTVNPAGVARNESKTTYVYNKNTGHFAKYVGSGNIPAYRAYLEAETSVAPASARMRIINAATGVENTAANVNVNKVMIDGQLFIVREGKMYNVQGALVK